MGKTLKKQRKKAAKEEEQNALAGVQKSGTKSKKKRNYAAIISDLMQVSKCCERQQPTDMVSSTVPLKDI